MQEDHYEGALLEEIKDQNRAVLEAVGMMQDSVKKIPKMSERLEKIEHDMAMVKLATMNTGSDLKIIKIRTEKIDEIFDKSKDHEKRIIRLETTTQ